MNATALNLHPVADAGAPDLALLTTLLGNAELAAGLLEAFGSLPELGRRPVADLHLAGLSPAQATKLFAALELGRRSLGPTKRELFSRPDKVADYFRPRLAALPHEEFWVAALDTKSRLIRAERVAQGGFTACSVMPREIFAPAIRAGAVALVLVHNHPSGDPAPSVDDLNLTARMMRAGNELGIRVLDHVVIGGDGYASFAQLGHLR